MRVLVAPDKFKASLSSQAVARAIGAGLDATGVDTVLLPLADGGDGSVDAAVAADFVRRHVRVSGADDVDRQASIAVRGRTALVEVANTCGLGTLPPGMRRPVRASSFGLGQAMAEALRLSPSRLVIASGGSASTDGGIGMLTALGYRFLDRYGNELRGGGGDLAHIHDIDSSRSVVPSDVELVLAADVTNPLLGPSGAAAVYGPQKGADEDAIALLDTGLRNLVQVLGPRGTLLAGSPGAGCAGGIGFGAMLLGARVASGADFYLDLLDFDSHVRDVDVVVTGEGSIDHQTGNGKLVSAVVRSARPVPVIGVAGRCTLDTAGRAALGLADIHVLADFTTQNTATDPALTRSVLGRIGRAIGASLATG